MPCEAPLLFFSSYVEITKELIDRSVSLEVRISLNSAMEGSIAAIGMAPKSAAPWLGPDDLGSLYDVEGRRGPWSGLAARYHHYMWNPKRGLFT